MQRPSTVPVPPHCRTPLFTHSPPSAVESMRADHRRQAELLLDALLHHRARNPRSGAAADSAMRALFTVAAPAFSNKDRLEHAHPLESKTAAQYLRSLKEGEKESASAAGGEQLEGGGLPKSAAAIPSTFRIGIAGPPGAGKSTLIEAFGMFLVQKMGLRVAVIAVDPSSCRSGGSILGDKTRMTELSRHPNAFVRPSPTRGTLGGLAQHTNDVVLLCEGAGYDVVLVETVGLGQSEVTIDATVDMLLLVVPPAGGDELQGVKKGIVEVADAVLVNKSDGDFEAASRHAAAEYSRALQLVRRKHGDAWFPDVLRVSALKGMGLQDLWECAADFWRSLGSAGIISSRRQEQSSSWMWNSLAAELTALSSKDPRVQAKAQSLVPVLAHGVITPRRAARELARQFLSSCADAAEVVASEQTGAEGKPNTTPHRQ